jgi:hypothetical protein
MSRKTSSILIVLGLTILVAAGIARAQAGQSVYLPLAFRPPPTATRTPWARPLPTNTATATLSPGIVVHITKINYDPPGSDIEFEYVVVRNEGSFTVPMAGWTLRDNEDNVFRFPTFSLSPGKVVTIHTCYGYNTTTDLYWKQERRAIWNNDHDCAFLNNSSEELIDMLCY